MARSHGRILSSIWAPGSDFLTLESGPQRTFMFLLSQEDLSHAGLIPLRIRRWAKSAPDLTPDIVTRDLKALEAARYVLIDEDTEELLIRTYVRGDGVYKQPKVMIRMGEDARQMQSPRLRAAFAAEMRRLPLHDLSDGPQAMAREVVGTLLAQFDPAGNGDPDTHADTPAQGYAEGFGEGSGRVPDTHADTPLRAGDRVPLPPSPFPQPPTGGPGGSGPSADPPDASQQAAPPKTRRGTRLPEGWLPPPELVEEMRLEVPDVDTKAEHRRFTDHWRATTGRTATKLDWEATWRNWMREANDRLRRRNGGFTPAPAQGAGLWDREIPRD